MDADDGAVIVGGMQTFNYLPATPSVVPRCGQEQVAVLTPMYKAKAWLDCHSVNLHGCGGLGMRTAPSVLRFVSLLLKNVFMSDCSNCELPAL